MNCKNQRKFYFCLTKEIIAPKKRSFDLKKVLRVYYLKHFFVNLEAFEHFFVGPPIFLPVKIKAFFIFTAHLCF